MIFPDTKFSPELSKEWREKGVKAFNKKDYQSAVEYFDKALSIRKKDLVSCMGKALAMSFIGIGDFEENYETYYEILAIADYPLNWAFENHLYDISVTCARCCELMGNPLDALSYLSRLDRDGKNDVFLLRFKASLLLSTFDECGDVKDIKAAIKHLKRVDKLTQGSCPVALKMLDVAYSKAGDSVLSKECRLKLKRILCDVRRIAKSL